MSWNCRRAADGDAAVGHPRWVEVPYDDHRRDASKRVFVASKPLTVSELHAGFPSLHVTEHCDGPSLHSNVTELQPSLPMQSNLPSAHCHWALKANPHRQSMQIGALPTHGDA